MDLNMIITLSAAIILLLSVLWAIIFKKHAVMRLVCVAIRAALAFVGTLIFKSQLIKSGKDTSAIISQLLGADNPISEIIAASPAIMDIALGLTASMLSVIIFVILYFILGIVMLLVRMIACIILRKRKKRVSFISRAVCGLIQGFIILTCVLVPISTYADVAASAVPLVSQVSDRDMSSGEKSVSEFNSCFVLKAHRLLGGKALSSALTSIDVKIGQKTSSVSLTTEVDAICTFITNSAPLIKTPLASYTDKEIEALNGLGGSLTKSKLLSAIIAEVLGDASVAWDKGETYMGIDKPSLDPTFDPLIHKSISILGSDASDTKHLKEDINTFAQVISKLITAAKQTEQPEGEEANLANAIMAKGLVKDLLTTINANPRMRPLIPVITNIGLSIVTDSIGIDADAAESYNRLTSAIAGELNASAALSADERLDKMTAAINNALAELNITDIDETEIYIISMSVLSYFDGSTNKAASAASADDVAAFLDEMTQAVNTQDGSSQTPVSAGGDYGMSTLISSASLYPAQAGQLIVDICNIQNNPSLTTEQKEAQIASLLTSSPIFTQNSADLTNSKLTEIKLLLISSAEREGDKSIKAMQTVGKLTPNAENTVFIYTLDKILIDENVIISDISEQSMAKLIDSIDLVFSHMSDIMSSIGGADSTAALKAICQGFGAMLDALAENEQFYGAKKTDTFLEAMLYSKGIKEMTSMSALDIRTLLSTRSEKNVSYAALLGTVSETVSTLSSIKDGSSVTTENIGLLVDSLTNESAGAVIATIITPEKLTELGISADDPAKTESASALLQAIFTNVSETGDETHEKEVAALKNIISIATDASSTQEVGGSAFGADGRLGITADDMVDSFLASESVCKALTETELVENPFGLELLAEDQMLIQTTLSEKLATADDDNAEVLYSIASLFGVTL